VAIDGVHPDARFPVWRGVDFGIRVSVCYWAEIQGQKLVVWDEVRSENKTTDGFAEIILAGDVEWGLTTMHVLAGADPAGVARNTQTAVTDIQVLQRKGIP